MTGATAVNVNRSLAYFLGAGAIGLAIAVGSTEFDAPDILGWMTRTLGIVFLGLTGTLTFVTIFCLVNVVQRRPGENAWLEAGLQAASGIATMALTFTLLGISLGIGSLASQELTPATVQVVIRELTEQFSLAFFTTVIGLPLSTILRGALLVSHAVVCSRSEVLLLTGESR